MYVKFNLSKNKSQSIKKRRFYTCTAFLDYLNDILIIFHASLIIMKVKNFIDNYFCEFLIFWFLKFTFNTFLFLLKLDTFFFDIWKLICKNNTENSMPFLFHTFHKTHYGIKFSKEFLL